MKDKLARYLHPTADMKKAIDRNAKQDEDLSAVLKQLDKEKKSALNQLSRKQEAFQKEMIKRQESLPQQFKVQFFQQRNVVGEDQPRPAKATQGHRLLRRTLSCPEETSSSAISQLPAVIRKRYSLPASPSPSDSRGKSTSHFNFKAGSEKTSPQRTEHKQRGQEDDHIEALPAIKMFAKSEGFTAQNSIRRHSDGYGADLNNSRLLQRRRTVTTINTAPVKTYLNETVVRL